MRTIEARPLRDRRCKTLIMRLRTIVLLPNDIEGNGLKIRHSNRKTPSERERRKPSDGQSAWTICCLRTTSGQNDWTVGLVNGMCKLQVLVCRRSVKQHVESYCSYITCKQTFNQSCMQATIPLVIGLLQVKTTFGINVNNDCIVWRRAL